MLQHRGIPLGSRSSDAFELDEQRRVRVPASVGPLESVPEADYNSPILQQVAHQQRRDVGRITANWEPSSAIKKRDDDHAMRLRVVRTMAKQCCRQDHRCWIRSLLVRAPDIGCPDGLRWKNRSSEPGRPPLRIATRRDLSVKAEGLTPHVTVKEL